MQRFFKSKGFKILIMVLVALIVGSIVSAATHNSSTPVSSVVGTVMHPVQRLSSFISGKLRDFSLKFQSSSQLLDKVNELESEIEGYREDLIGYEKAKKKLSLYEEFLGVKEENPDFEFVPAQIIGRDAINQFYSFTLNKGTSKGVNAGDPVICGQYLVGYVTGVTPTRSTVSTILDPTVNVSAYDIKTDETGFVSGSAAHSINQQCKFSGLEKNTSITVGSIICTSGAGEIYPRDLYIGKVLSIENESHDISSYALLEPGVDFSLISEVFIITSFEE